jgi:hypothetical protein
VLLASREPADEVLDSAGLVAARLIAAHQLKIHWKIIPEGRRSGEDAAVASISSAVPRTEVCHSDRSEAKWKNLRLLLLKGGAPSLRSKGGNDTLDLHLSPYSV